MITQQNPPHITDEDHAPGERIREACRALLRRIGWPSRSGGIRSIGVTSCHRSEGVSTVAMHLAEAATGPGRHKILLVDANLEHPALHRALGARLGPGLAEMLVSGRRLADCVQPSQHPNLSLLTAGRGDAAQTAARDASHLADLVQSIEAEFDLAIFDMPSTADATSSAGLAGHLGGVLLVIEAERVRAEVARRTKDLLIRDGAELLGVVMNKRPQHVPDWLYNTL